MHAAVSQYPWAQELEKTVVHSLATSFGLDFLLLKDQHGGDVNTVHNARQGVYASEAERSRYDQRGEYRSRQYRADKAFTDRGKAEAERQDAGALKDAYTRKSMPARKGVRDLDHTISAKSVHDDPGRVLAELDGVALANHATNLNSTHRSVNRSKNALPVEDFLHLRPTRIAAERVAQDKDRQRLERLPRETPEQRHKVRQLESRIEARDVKLRELESVDPEAMRKKDKIARKQYNGTIDRQYYTSSKFCGETVLAAGQTGLRMGTRQMLGLVAAEVWFELREALPALGRNLKSDFSLDAFMKEAKAALAGIWKRVQGRFKAFLTAFKDGVFGGILGSVTTTVLNVFATTAKNAIKIIREMWSQLGAAIRLWMFNPDQLSSTELTQAVLALLSGAVAAVVGSLVYAQLVPVLGFPFGQELAAFACALITGVVTMGLHYFLLHSSMMKRVWEFMDRSSHALTLRQFEALNAQLDEYLEEIARIELNIDADGLAIFQAELASSQTETQRGKVIARAIKKEGISLPFEMGEAATTRRWLASLAK